MSWKAEKQMGQCSSEIILAGFLSFLRRSCALLHLAPKDVTVLGTCQANGVQMQSGTEQGDLNTLVSPGSPMLFPEVFSVQKGETLNEVPEVML